MPPRTRVAVAALLACAALPAGAHAAGFSAPVDVSGWQQGEPTPNVLSLTPDVAIAYWEAPGNAAVPSEVVAEALTPLGSIGAGALDIDARGLVAASDGDGSASFAWDADDENGLPEVRLIDFDPIDGFGSGEVIDAPAGAIRVARNSRGDTLVAYLRYDANPSHVYARFRAAGAAGFEAPVRISGVPVVPGAVPEVSLAGDGSAAVAWRDLGNKAGDRPHVAVTLRNAAAGAWTAPALLSDSGRNGEHPRVAVTAGGGTLVVWREFSGDPSSDWFAAPRDVRVALRAPGQGFGTPQRIAGHSDTRTQLPMAGAGDVGEAVIVALDAPAGGARTIKAWVADLVHGTLGAPVAEGAASADSLAFAMNRDSVGVLARSDGCSPCLPFSVSTRAPAQSGFPQRAAVMCPPPWPVGIRGLDVDARGQAVVAWHDYDRNPATGQLTSRPPKVSFQSASLPTAQCDPPAAPGPPPPPPPPPPPAAPRPPAQRPPATTPPAPPPPAAVALEFPARGGTLSRGARELMVTVGCIAACRLDARLRIVLARGAKPITSRRRLTSSRRNVVVRFKLSRTDGRRVARSLRRNRRVRATIRVAGTSLGRTTVTTRVLRVRAGR